MKESGYFKATSEYDKAMIFVKRGIVPEWLKQDINEYYKRMNQKQIGITSYAISEK